MGAVGVVRDGGAGGGGVEVKGRGSVGWKRQKRESGRSGELEREGRGGVREKDPRTENMDGNEKQDRHETPHEPIFRLILVYHYYSEALLGILIRSIKTRPWSYCTMYFHISFPPIICPLCVCKYFQDGSPPSHPPSLPHVTGIQLYSASLLPLFLHRPPHPNPPLLLSLSFPLLSFILSVFSLWFPAQQYILGEPHPSSPLPLPHFHSLPPCLHLSSTAPFLARV